ncbi:MAG: 4a-hydroxytetrahydrobiopterin dehydratase [Chloroflexota bacterium]
MAQLVDRSFIEPIRLTNDESRGLLNQIPGWEILQTSPERLVKTYRFDDFAGALAFCNVVGAIAESAGHHPEMVTSWAQTEVRWWTHSVQGLSLNDFIMAARTDQAASRSGPAQ